MSRQLTTTLSDGVLMITSLFAALRLHQSSANWHLHLLASTIYIGDTPIFGIACFLLVALASGLGAFRFCFQVPPHRLLVTHKRASWWAAVVGFSLLAANFNFAYNKAMVAWCHMLSIVAVYIGLKFLPHKFSEVLTQIQQITSFVSIGGVCVTNHNWQGAVGVHIIPVAAIIVGTDGKVLGIPAVDVFHYMVACSIYLLCRALISVYV